MYFALINTIEKNILFGLKKIFFFVVVLLLYIGKPFNPAPKIIIIIIIILLLFIQLVIK